ncbi:MULTISPECIES: hypothetical protein [unclassified Sulfuricurvum]|uniref:hypothetical protein n=1 Tax=unclassified Sulfuricurvum TaxID=2632390 RepID=UPI0002998CDD|nr:MULTISPECIES: hypothetical protein [unclassified Sulfuricurvum]AFV97225.1 hypothetical protein B649_04555 [Candidatus Sulfuricurvum sp. RIFRC-1]HBM34875.1 hypothetical protein [Sulfuricurvum sp.]
MSTKFLLLSTLTTFLLAQNNPTLYSLLGNKLYDANSKFETFVHYEILKDKIFAYSVQSKSLREQGLSLESKGNISANEYNEYLSSLRLLENKYIGIVHLLHQMMLSSIRENDYDTFFKINTSAPSDFLQSYVLESQAIAFYQKNKHRGRIASLERLICDKQLAQQAESLQTHDGKGVYVTKKPIKKYGTQIDQEHTLVGGRGGLEITANQTVAQSFLIAQSGRLIAFDLIDIKHHRCTPTKSLHVSLVTMENGRLGPHSYYTRELHPNEISPTTRLYFGHYGPMVKPGEQYAIYLKSDAEPGGCTYAWSGDYETYHGGKTFINETENIRDMKFRSYVLIN